MRAKSIVSGGVILVINGRNYGRAIGFQWESDTARSAKYGLDVMNPVELAPTVTRVTGQVTIRRTVGDGGVEGVGMAATYDLIPNEKYFTMQLIELASNTSIFEARYCSLTRQAWSAPVKGFVDGQISFEALDLANEYNSQ
jgi:hypothetical protein